MYTKWVEKITELQVLLIVSLPLFFYFLVASLADFLGGVPTPDSSELLGDSVSEFVRFLALVVKVGGDISATTVFTVCAGVSVLAIGFERVFLCPLSLLFVESSLELLDVSKPCAAGFVAMVADFCTTFGA